MKDTQIEKERWRERETRMRHTQREEGRDKIESSKGADRILRASMAIVRAVGWARECERQWGQ